VLQNRSVTLRRRATHSISIITCLGITVSALVMTPFTSATKRTNLLAEGQNQTPNRRKVQPLPPEKGRPATTLPDLDQIRKQRPNPPEIKPAIGSSVRSKRKPLKPWDGRKFGDPGTTGPAPLSSQRGGSQSAGVSFDSKFNHRSPRSVRNLKSPSTPPPPLPDDTYIQSFVGNALGRSIYSNEQAYWDDIVRSAYYHGQDSLILAARELGRTLFESADYASRGRSNHDYVYDLYMTYLMRDPSDPNNPDYGGWNF